MEGSRVVARRFRLLSKAGAGGMGVVFRAIDESNGEHVAVKLLTGATVADTQRFLRESRLVSELRHPRVVRHVAHGQDDDGTLYFAMEWLDGEDLGRRLARGPLPLDAAVRIALHVAEALGAAHGAGIVHRDVKPANVFLRGGDVDGACLLDFGIARGGETATRLTGTGMFVGTPSYMAPEQAAAAAVVDTRADLFGLGCILYESLVGVPAFGGETLVAVLAKILFADAPHLPQTDEPALVAIDELIQRLLAKQPDARPRSADEVRAALSAVGRASHAPTSTRPRAVGTREDRVLAVVLGTSPEGRLAPTIPVSPLPSTPPGAATPSSVGADVHTLPDGSVLCLVRGGSARDQAVAAVRSALALQRLRPDLHIAVATGRATTGAGVPMGDAIDRASALLRDARDKSVRVDSFTAELVRERYEVAERDGELVVVASADARVSDSASRPQHAAYVGRTRELAFARSLLEEAEAESSARVVLVTGTAGIGKSRLRREIAGEREAEGTWAVWGARGEELGVTSPHAMVGQLVRVALGVREGGDASAAVRTVHERVASLGDDDARFIAAFLCEVGGALPPADAHPYLGPSRSDAALFARHVTRALRLWLEVELRARPVLLILEDLHWGDAASVDAIDECLRALRDRPLVVFALARPEVHDRFSRLFDAHAPSEIRLGPLPRSAAQRLAAELVGDAPQAVIDTLVARADGVPLMLEELARAHASGGLGDAHRSLGALIEARLLELPPEARRVLRAASVFGSHAWPTGIAALLGTTNDVVDALVDDLVEREILVCVTSRFAGEREVAFRHALFRDVAYQMLPDEDRRAAHLGALDWLRAHAESDRVVIATHLERGASTDADRVRAVEAILALERHLRSTDLLASWVERVRALLEALGDRAAAVRLGLEMTAAECNALRRTDARRAATRIQEWILEARASGDETQLAAGLAMRATVRANARMLDAADADVVEAKGLLRGESAIPLAILVLTSAHVVRLARGELRSALDVGIEVLELARRGETRYQRATAAHNVGDVAMRLGRFAQARALLGESDECNENRAHVELYELNRSVTRFIDGIEGDSTAAPEIALLRDRAAANGEDWNLVQMALLFAVLRAWEGDTTTALAALRDVDALAASRGHELIAVDARIAIDALQAGRRPWFFGGEAPVSES